MTDTDSFPVTDADLTTDRLVLRSWTPGEVAAVLEGARPAHWAEDFPAEGDHVIAGLFAEHPAWLDRYGHRQIIERDSGLVVGSIGLFWPPGDGTLEIGYGIVPSRRGRGYAPEATRALTEYAFTAPGVHTVYANVEPSNPSSIRVLEKAGFRRADADPGQNTARYHATPPARR
ncbi:RimJ/RimL family protein N-acetyltransferase [Streptosporangium becharense]|uniref:RimJ/RimL family protein N-acetyltransferase n=1 Tax=Streptosporangium becharense TaxID=1816182 RepID=A0A7W9IG69_9ACTN|nr:GNAT family N-acetyltransferase [Streptosporangium becharense]MBB2908840.1 RimJ/RimL family protein N-acetyltransferase [Streptosporangium becharense]MBB5820142.1 RimJ/RimL family protein N-acetyltransferase [Streptosporangium becharense]